MQGLIIFLGIVVGIVVFLGIVFFIVWYKLKKAMHKAGLGNLKLNNIVSSMVDIKESESKRVRSISGMSKLLIPNIIKDFPEFNENQLYNMTEESMRIVFDALSNKDKSSLNEIPLVRNSIIKIIDDYKDNNIDVKYSDIIFHKFAIKDYNKSDGVATITVSTSLEYYYEKNVDGKCSVNSRYKKQTRYSCKFIYIYDESLFKDHEVVLGVNCPNCGASITNLGHKHCDYCGSSIKEINLKSWAFSSYEEY